MGSYNLVERLIVFYRKNGLLKTLIRIWLSFKRLVWKGQMVLFYCALEEIQGINEDQLNSIEIERIRRENDIPSLALIRLLNHWNEKIMRRKISENFGKGAVLWLVKLDKKYAGFGWSITGSSIEPYFFPLFKSDAHFFNFYIFPEYRGQGINPYLVNQMLIILKKEGVKRAFIETHAWNKVEIRSLKKTYFRKLGMARKITIFRKSVVFWLEMSV